MTSLRLVTPPASEPITLSEAMAHLRLDASALEPVPGAPLVALAGAGAGGVDVGTHRYRVTFVTADGETDGGAISDVVTVADAGVDGKVALTEIPIGGGNVVARKIYRTVADGSEYFLAATLADNSTTAHVDTAADAALGAGIPLVNSTGDPFVQDLIVAARQVVEQYLGRALVTQTWRFVRDGFPGCDVLELPRPTLQSVTSVSYVDQMGVTRELDPTWYEVDTASFPGRIVLGYARYWPYTRAQRNGVSVEFVAGFGTPADVPRPITRAMLLLIGHWYGNRDAINVGNIINELPFGVEALLSPYRLLEG